MNFTWPIERPITILPFPYTYAVLGDYWQAARTTDWIRPNKAASLWTHTTALRRTMRHWIPFHWCICALPLQSSSARLTVCRPVKFAPVSLFQVKHALNVQKLDKNFCCYWQNKFSTRIHRVRVTDQSPVTIRQRQQYKSFAGLQQTQQPLVSSVVRSRQQCGLQFLYNYSFFSRKWSHLPAHGASQWALSFL